jgi:hypothetical protein
MSVLSGLLQGIPDSRIAEELKVNRSTIARWKKDPTFDKELSRQRQALKDVYEARLLSMMDKALFVCDRALDEGNTRVALQLIKRFDQNQLLDRQENPDLLPRIFINMQPPSHNYSIPLEELLELNRSVEDKEVFSIREDFG